MRTLDSAFCEPDSVPRGAFRVLETRIQAEKER